MNNATAYTFGFAFGYAGLWTILCGISYLFLAPFSYGYVGAELMCGYCLWCTIRDWDNIVSRYYSVLDEYQ